MGIIAAMKRLSSLKAEDILTESLEDKDIQDKMIELNQDQLFEQGIQADNTVTGNYSPMTIRMKEAMGQRTDHITLVDTGEFYESMKVEVNEDTAFITGESEKDNQDLSDRWPQALGLTPDSLNEVKPLIVSKMKQIMKEAI